MGYYVIKFFSEVYKLQEDTTCDLQISIYDELVVKAQYMNCMQDKKVVLGTTRKKTSFEHPCLYIMASTEAKKNN